MAAYEAAFDYLDCLCEMPNPNPITNGRQLNQALIVAVKPGLEHVDYYAYHASSDDGGYLRALVESCQTALSLLPAYSSVSDALTTVSSRIAAYQSLNHGDAEGSHGAFVRWAMAETVRLQGGEGPDLYWWEIGAACGSSLIAFALIAAATDPITGRFQVAEISSAYFPWIGAVNSLLDSMVDGEEDDAPGQHRLLDYYASPQQTSYRLELIVKQASLRARDLPSRYGHLLIFVAMTSFYLSSSEAQTPDLSYVRERLRKNSGGLDRPTMLIMRARGVANLIGRP